MDNNEKIIVQKLKRGDEKAYRYLFDTYYTLLCRMAADFLNDNFLAETIVGDTIYNLWEKRETIDIQSSLRSYMIRAVRNRCINYLQLNHVRREIHYTSDEFIQKEDAAFVSDQYSLFPLLEKELEDEILHSVDRLPCECRTVFKMSRFENLKYREIADKLDISIDTVKYHIKNALSKLTADLGRYLIIILVLL